jgi:hypothetical protein
VDLHRLYDKQGIDSLQQFLKHYRTRTTPIGNTTEIALAWAQYIAGTSTSIFADTKTPLPHLPAFLLGAIRQYLGTIDAQIELEKTHVAPIQRESDTHIMDWVVNYSNFGPADIKAVNYCRLYFNVVTVSDITNAQGTHIDELTGQERTVKSEITPHGTSDYRTNQHRQNHGVCGGRHCICLLMETGNLITPWGNGSTLRNISAWHGPSTMIPLAAPSTDATMTHSLPTLATDKTPQHHSYHNNQSP